MTHETDAMHPAADTASLVNREPLRQDEDTSPRNAVDRAFAAVDAQQEMTRARQSDQINAWGSASTETSSNTPASVDQSGGDGEGTPQPADTKGSDSEKQETEDFSRSQDEPPGRFSDEAKDAWRQAPASIRAEVHRLERELTEGLEKYRSNAEAFEEYRPFAEKLQQTGQKFGDVVGYYTGIEDLLAKDPLQGLDVICRNLGTSLSDVAARLTGRGNGLQPGPEPDPLSPKTMSPQDVTIRGLREELSGLKRQIGDVSQTVSSQTQRTLQSQIDTFAQSNPRFQELGDDVAFFLQSGRAQDLQDAYRLAERLNPVPPPAVSADNPADVAQTRKGQLSVTGAPGSGSNPINRQPPSSARDALDNAFASLGIG